MYHEKNKFILASSFYLSFLYKYTIKYNIFDNNCP